VTQYHRDSNAVKCTPGWPQIGVRYYARYCRLALGRHLRLTFDQCQLKSSHVHRLNITKIHAVNI